MEKSRFILSRSLALLHRQQSCFRTSLQKPFCRTYYTTHAAAMGRMHSRGKGISASALPYKRTLPSWLKISSQDVEESIHKFAKKSMTPSQIGVILRDSHGIAQVKSVTGSKVSSPILDSTGTTIQLQQFEMK